MFNPEVSGLGDRKSWCRLVDVENGSEDVGGLVVGYKTYSWGAGIAETI